MYWYLNVPTKWGLGLPLNRWKMLVDSLDFLDQASMEKREYKSHLGRNMYATIGHNILCVDPRQHYFTFRTNRRGSYKIGDNIKTCWIRLAQRRGKYYWWLCSRVKFRRTLSLQFGPSKPAGIFNMFGVQSKPLHGMVNESDNNNEMFFLYIRKCKDRITICLCSFFNIYIKY